MTETPEQRAEKAAPLGFVPWAIADDDPDAVWVLKRSQARALLARLAEAEEERGGWNEAAEKSDQTAMTEWRRRVAAEADRDRYRDALERIAKRGPVFDAKGTWSKEVCSIARAALDPEQKS